MEKSLKIALYAMMGMSAVLSVFQMKTGDASIVIPWCYVLVGIAAIAAVVFPIIRMASDIKSAKNSLMGLIALLAIFGISYSLASSEILPSYEGYVDDEAKVKLIGGSIYAFYFLAIGAIGSTIYSEVSGMLK